METEINNAPKMRIFACQASYGDTLGLELDPQPPRRTGSLTDTNEIKRKRLESDTRMFFLIDGGPAVQKMSGTTDTFKLPIAHLYKMLADLVPMQSTGLDTLVVTHDDLDHIIGISELLRRLTTKPDTSLWPQGINAVAKKRAPFQHIWHNSAETIVKNFGLKEKRKEYMELLGRSSRGGRKSGEEKERLRDSERSRDRDDDLTRRRRDRSTSTGKERNRADSDGRERKKKKNNKNTDGDASHDEDNSDTAKKAPKKIPDLNKGRGYFDEALDRMKNQELKTAKGKYLTFNDEWSDTKDEEEKYHGLLRKGRQVTRGDTFEFTFLGPGYDEIEELATFFTRNVSTKASIRQFTDKNIEKEWEPTKVDSKFKKLGADLISSVKDDPSKKNVSSIVFEVKDKSGKGLALFTGDASACRIFGEKWEGEPIFYDLIKIFSTGMMNEVLKKIKDNPPLKDQAWLPYGSEWKLDFPGEVDPDSCESISLGNVLGYFCNVRARNYLISASHDKHPNPHLSTLVGIIAASVIEPKERDPDPASVIEPPESHNRGPVRIYLTNPVAKQAWDKLLKFWFKVLPMSLSETEPTSEIPTVCTSESETFMENLLKYRDKEEELRGSFQGRALLALNPGANNADRCFQFYCLKPNTSYGAIRISSYQGLDDVEEKVIEEEDEAWEPITPHDPRSEAFLQHHYAGEFGILGSVPTQWSDDKIARLQLGKDGEAVFILLESHSNKAPPSTPVREDDQTPWKPGLISLYNNSILNSGGWDGDTGIPIINTNTNFYFQQNTVTFRGMANGPPIPSSMKQKKKTKSDMVTESEGDTPPNSSTRKRKPNPVQTPVTTRERTPTTSSSDAPKANYDMFRKFNVDPFEIPSADDFATKAKMKIKHLDSFARFLAYLVENNQLSKEHAINAGTKHTINGHPTLGALTYLILGIQDAGTVLRTLPFDLSTTLQLLDDRTLNPLHWPVQLVDVAVVDTSILEKLLEKQSGVQQFTMRIFPQIQPEDLVWVVPNEATLLGKGRFEIKINGCVDVTVHWPTDPKRRIVHGRFLGSLPTGKEERHNVVCEWLLMPGESSPVVYHVDFADENHNTVGHEMNILKMLAAFDGVSVDLGLALADVVVPGLINPDKPLGKNIKFSEPGFTIYRSFQNSQSLRLGGVFGKFSVEGVKAWAPFRTWANSGGLKGFLSKIKIPTPSIRLCVQDFFSSTGTRIFFRINHSIKIGGSDLAYEIETRPGPRGECLFEFTFRPVNSETQKPLTIKQLLETFGLSALSSDHVPQFVIDAISAVSLTYFRLGWSGKLGVRLPDYLELGIRVENLSVVGSLLDIEDVFVRLRIDNPSQKETRNFYLQSGGTFSLVGIEHIARLTYGYHPALLRPQEDESLIGPVSLVIECVDSPLTLGHILQHFWPNIDIIPAPFNKVTNEVGLREFVFETDYSSEQKKQVVELVKIGIGVTRNRITILDNLTLIEPTLEITVHSPFDKELRAFMVTFSTMVMIEGHALLVKLGVATGDQAAFAIALRGGGEPFPVGVFLKFVSKKVGKALSIPYPENFGALDRTEINDFSLFVAKGKNGKYSIREFSFQAQSRLQLKLWGSPPVVLEHISLNTCYRSAKGLDVAFGAELRINDHVLLASAKYGSPKSNGSNLLDGAGSHHGGKAWFIEVEYRDEIDLLAIAMKLMNIELGQKIAQSGIVKPDNDKGIVIRNLVMTLQKAKSGGGIYISADTDWSVFNHIELAATYYGTSQWGICLSIDLKNDLLSLIPADFVRVYSEWIKVNKTKVALYLGKIDPKKAGLKSSRLPPQPNSRGTAPSSSIQAGLAVSTTIQLTEKFGLVKKWVGHDELEIEGHISTQSVGMSAKIPTQLTFGDKNKKTGKYPLEIQGSFFFDIDKKGIQVGLAAAMKIHCPSVTNGLIDVQRVALLVNSASGVGFEAILKGPLRNLFGLDGLEARDLSMKGVFSVAQSGFPDELSLTGELSLAGTGACGRIALYFAQRDLLNCYFSGQLRDLDIAAVINFALEKRGFPKVAKKFLKGNAVINNLELEAALSDIEIPQLKKRVKRGFFYEASLYIKATSYQWSGYTCIEVRDDALQFITMMSPVSFASKSEQFFRLTRGSIIPQNHSIPQPKGKHYENMFNDGPIIYISNKNPGTWLLISLHLTILSVNLELTAKGDPSGFELDIPKNPVDLDLSKINLPAKFSASLEGSAKVVPNEMASAKLKIDVTLTLELPSILLYGLGRQLSLPGKMESVEFDLDFKFSIGWPQTGMGFNLTLTGIVRTLDQEIDLFNVAVNMSPKQLDTVHEVVRRATIVFLERFPNEIVKILTGMDLNETLSFFKNKFSHIGKKLLAAISLVRNIKPLEVINRLGREALGFIGDKAKEALLAALEVFYGLKEAMSLMLQKFDDLLNSPSLLPGGKYSGPTPSFPRQYPIGGGAYAGIRIVKGRESFLTLEKLGVPFVDENDKAIEEDKIPSVQSTPTETSMTELQEDQEEEPEGDDEVFPAGMQPVDIDQGDEMSRQEWTQQQIRRLSLLEASLELFGVEEVYEAARSIFEDLSDEQVVECMLEANTNEAIVDAIQALG